MALSDLLSRLATQTVPALLTALGTAQLQPLAHTPVDNGAGGTRKVWAAAGSPLPCSYEILTPEQAERRVGEQPKGVLVYVFTVAAASAVTTKQRVRLLAHGAVTERDMEVLHVAEPSGVVKQIYAAFEERA